ncbi:MAG: 50S ribosomal protein L14 [Armatimonadota bacterium]|jgi:large subunit ribosomal protein L14
MIQPLTRLRVADNSGVHEIMCIGIVGKGTTRRANVGDIIVASAKQVTPRSSIVKGEIVKAVVVRVRNPTRRADGSYIKFDDNAAVIVDNQNNPRCTRIFGPVARELRDREHMKIVSLAPEVV